MKKLFRLVLALVLAMTLIWVVGVSALFDGDGSTRYTANNSHGKSEQSDAADTDTLAPQATGPIIADHTVVDKYDDIPQEYIDIVKTMWLNVPGESHSRGYRYGLQFLEDLDPTYAVNVTEEGEPEGSTDQHLRVSAAVRNQYNKWSWGAGEKTWYTWLAWDPSDPGYPADEANKLKNHLTYANTNGLEIAALGFGWCWDMTWMNPPTGTIDSVFQVRWAGSSVGGPDGNKAWGLDDGDNTLVGNRVNMDTYISATQAYIDHCADNGYDTKVFFTTGPVEGGWTPDDPNENRYQRYLKHEHIRDYVRARSDAILFDYADILTWNDDGEQRTMSWTDYGGTEHAIPYIHSDNMLQLDGGPHVEDGDHIGERGALRLGKALWWMLARMAGWDGTPADSGPQKTASAGAATQNETITYTITIRDLAAPLTATVLLTDTVPTGLAYVPGTLTATAGSVDDTAVPTLTWTGVLSPTPAVTITYAVTVATPDVQLITNTAVIAAQGYLPITRTATVSVTPPFVQLPDLTPSYKAVSPAEARHGQTVTYTVAIRNSSGPLSQTVLLTDTVPTGLAYVPGTLTATAGSVDDTAAPTLTWSGVLSPTPVVTVTYVTTVAASASQIITNMAVIDVPGYQVITRTATITVNPFQIYLPLVLREDSP